MSQKNMNEFLIRIPVQALPGSNSRKFFQNN
jgi:hypothetical protein